MEKLHPGVKWSFRLGGYALMIFVFFFSFAFAIAGTQFLGGIFLVLYLILFLLALIILPEIYAQLAYHNWGYEFTKTNLKIEKGIIWKKYSNVPYERVQNVDIQRGIIARIFGFSTVNIQTAGYSGYPRGPVRSEGYIPGVSIEKAEKIRDFVISRIGKRQGL
jgi:membrane protein YdbS with pleckstrin-like domain